MYDEAAVLRAWEDKWLDPDYDMARGRYYDYEDEDDDDFVDDETDD